MNSKPIRRRSARKCGRCPKRSQHGVCLVRGEWISAFHDPCDYGIRMMLKEYKTNWAREQRKSKAGKAETNGKMNRKNVHLDGNENKKGTDDGK